MDIVAAQQRPADIKPRRICQQNAPFLQLRRQPPLVDSLELGQLGRRIDTRHGPVIGSQTRVDPHAISHSKGHQIRQVVLRLGVIRTQAIEPSGKARPGNRHDAGVDLVDGQLGGSCVSVLDDALDRSADANDAPVPGRIG